MGRIYFWGGFIFGEDTFPSFLTRCLPAARILSLEYSNHTMLWYLNENIVVDDVDDDVIESFLFSGFAAICIICCKDKRCDLWHLKEIWGSWSCWECKKVSACQKKLSEKQKLEITGLCQTFHQLPLSAILYIHSKDTLAGRK